MGTGGKSDFFVSTNPNTRKKNLRPIASLEIMTSYLECQTEAFSHEFGRHTYVRRVFKCFIYKFTFNLLLLNRNRVTLCLPGYLHFLSSANFVPKLLFFLHFFSGILPESNSLYADQVQRFFGLIWFQTVRKG